MATYRAAVLKAPRAIEIERRAVREPTAHEVVIAVKRVGVCGTDLALWGGQYEVPLPLVPGHELVGVVEAVGAAVMNVRPGDRVVTEINASCLARRDRELCPACLSSLERHCQRRTVVGIIDHGGGFAEKVWVPEGCVHRVPDALDDAVAAFAEPAAAALQTFEMCGDPSGLYVLVLGPGRLGALIAAVAADRGAHVAAMARSERSAARARAFGATEVFDMGDVEAARAWGRGVGADIVVEVTGVASSVGLALDLVRPRGIVAIKSTPGVPTGVDLTRMVVDEVSLVGSRCGPFPAALRWLQSTTWPVASMVERTYPLDDVADALDAALHLTKVVVEP